MTTDTGRPVSRAELPEGVTCALSPDGHLSHEDRWHIERFKQFLTDKDAVMADYVERLGPITADNAIAPLRTFPEDAEPSDDLVRMWGERTRRLRALIREYDADARSGATS